MTSRPPTDDKLDEVLAELEAARNDPAWVPEEPRSPRRLVRAPDALAEGRWVPSRPVVVVLAVCALLAVGIFAVRILLSSNGRETAAAGGSSHVTVSGLGATSSAASTGPSTAGNAATAGAPGKGSGQWSIHVVGAVKRPGVVGVSAGARVSDAVAAAGGLAPGADADGINLARPLSDGEQVHVPRPGEKWTPPPDSVPHGPGADANAGSDGAAGPASAGAEAGAKPGGAVNLNTASKEQLDSLPGVGPVMAQRILDWRQEHGRFSSVDELGEVSGIGDKTLERLKPKVTV